VEQDQAWELKPKKQGFSKGVSPQQYTFFSVTSFPAAAMASFAQIGYNRVTTLEEPKGSP
jgi:hypothetical protein